MNMTTTGPQGTLLSTLNKGSILEEEAFPFQTFFYGGTRFYLDKFTLNSPNLSPVYTGVLINVN